MTPIHARKPLSAVIIVCSVVYLLMAISITLWAQFDGTDAASPHKSESPSAEDVEHVSQDIFTFSNQRKEVVATTTRATGYVYFSMVSGATEDGRFTYKDYAGIDPIDFPGMETYGCAISLPDNKTPIFIQFSGRLSLADTPEGGTILDVAGCKIAAVQSLEPGSARKRYELAVWNNGEWVPTVHRLQPDPRSATAPIFQMSVCMSPDGKFWDLYQNDYIVVEGISRVSSPSIITIHAGPTLESRFRLYDIKVSDRPVVRTPVFTPATNGRLPAFGTTNHIHSKAELVVAAKNVSKGIAAAEAGSSSQMHRH